MNVDPDRAQRGSEIKITGTGFCPRLTVGVFIEPEEGAHESPVVANAKTDAKGRFSSSALVPTDLEPGRYRVGVGHVSVKGREDCYGLQGSEMIEITA